jgi:sugar phosphate permease
MDKPERRRKRRRHLGAQGSGITSRNASRPDARRWRVLGIALLGVVSANAFQYGLPFLIPALLRSGFSLLEASLLVSAPLAGLTSTLILWGLAADFWGERLILALGLFLSSLALVSAALARGAISIAVFLFAAGASGAAVNSSSGRLVLGWFSESERGLAMGIRQTAQPIGVAMAALALPPLAASYGGLDLALLFLAACCFLSAVLVAFMVTGPESDASAVPPPRHSPYRHTYLWRVHWASTLLIVPQFAVSTFAFVYLVSVREWNPENAGWVLAGGQLGGALMRLASGWWSDRIGSRLEPMRALAVVISVAMLTVGVAAAKGSELVVVGLLIATVVTLSPNGLAFTAVAERAGPVWAGRAIGVQNTMQSIVAAATPPVLSALAAMVAQQDETPAYHVMFLVSFVFSLVAACVIPVAAERAGHG